MLTFMKVHRVFKRVFTVLLLALLFLPANFSQAASVSGVSDIMSDQLPSASSNHAIYFTTPTGVSASGDTIVYTFAPGFDLTGLVVGDFDLSHGPAIGLETSETLAASAAAGVWGVAVSGQVITFTPPTDAAAGEVAANDIVSVFIGTNASGGSNQIVNPSSSGTYNLSFSGVFGDVGGITLLIGSDHYLDISATVSSPPITGGGGSGHGTVGATPPVISNVQAINITQTSANITWDTDTSANSLVSYGVDTSYGNTGSDAGYVVAHTIPLTSLTPDTLYHYQVSSSYTVGNTASTGDFTFRTLPPPSPPVITNVRALSITDHSAVIAWDTDIPSTSIVDYGLSTAYTSQETAAALVTNHAVILSGLSTAQLYHLQVSSVEATGLSASSGDNTFLTRSDVTPPANASAFTATAGDALNVLRWTNPPDLDFDHVLIIARTDHYPVSPSDGRIVYTGNATAMTDAGLTNGTTYFYTNFAYDVTGNRSSGIVAQATPLAGLPPPTPPTPPVTPPGTPPTTPPGTPPASGGTGTTTTTPPVIPPEGTTTTTPPVIPPVVSPEPPVSPTPPVSSIVIQPFYFGGAGQIPLSPDANGTITGISGSPILVQVSIVGIGQTPTSGTLSVQGSTYLLTPLPGGAAWGATFVPSGGAGTQPATVHLNFEDGSQAEAVNNLVLVSLGRVLGKNLFGQITPLADATLTLYDDSGTVVWDGSRYGQANPIKSNEDGSFAFLVPNGTYTLKITHDNYVSQERVIHVGNNILSQDIVLASRIKTPIVGAVLEALQSEQAQQAATIVAPVVLIAAAANVLASASLIGLLNYIWFFLTQPILLLGKKKRKKFGIVYNSLSKQPIDLVAVRLIHAKTGLVVQTRITDSKGRFFFRAKPGVYRLEAAKNGYEFPSKFVVGVKEDGPFLDVYHGENIEVKEESNISANIPIDPLVKEEVPRKVIIKKYLRKLQHAIALLSVVVTLFALFIAPSILLAAMLVGQVLTYLLFRRLALAGKPKGWGVVYDAKSRRPLGRSVVRIFDKKYNKLLETQVTDAKGVYGFFANENVFFVTAQKAGYGAYTSEDIDLTGKEEGVVDKHIPLQKADTKAK